VNLAVIAGGASVCAMKREPADFAVERSGLLLLLAHDILIAFTLDMQNQAPSPFGEFVGVNVNIEIKSGGRSEHADRTGFAAFEPSRKTARGASRPPAPRCYFAT